MGSTCNLIREDEVTKLALECDRSNLSSIHGYGGGFITSNGMVNFKLTIDDIEIPTTASVVPNKFQNTPLLLGHPVTEGSDIIMFKDTERLQLFNKLPNYDESHNDSRKITLWPKNKIEIPPGFWANVPVNVKDHFEGELYISASIRSEEGNEYCIPHTILQINQNHNAVLPLINLSDKQVTISQKSPIARGVPCKPDKQLPSNRVLKITKSQLKPLERHQVTIGPITEQEERQLMTLLNKHRTCFALKTDELGCAKSFEVEIELNQNTPFSYRPYHMARDEQRLVQEIVDDLYRNDIIRDSKSPYSSPILLVRKKNGEPRMCIDYRKLNQLTVKDKYPLPRVDDQLDKLQGSILYTSLDLKSGYHQIPMAEGSKKFTAFVTSEGQYEFNRLPFGLTNAPSAFQRLMNKILRPARDIAAVYLDDILLYTKTVAEGITNLEKVLILLEQEGLTLNPEKCRFLMRSVEYLGFEISNSLVKPGEAKTKAIKNFETPKSVHQIRQFIGLTGYFRHFVKNYAIIAKPLTDLTRKDEPWKWTEKEQVSFDSLKRTLMERPTLALYNPKVHTEVHTDASSKGLAGILLQKQQDRLHPVAYFSRKTTPAEEKYHSYELETLAVVESLKKFRVYLLGIEFVVITDCNALKASAKKKQLLPRIARWWLQLQEFSFTVEYRPGNRMRHVDALSRNPDSVTANKECVMKIEQGDWVLSAQLTDSKIQHIQEVLSKDPTTDEEKNIYKNYALRDGRVYRITVKGLQWVLPKGMRQQVVRAAHDDMGHFGVEKTLNNLCKHYWFPRMRHYVEKYISCCVPCIFSKKPSGKKEGFLHPIPKKPEPFDRLHIDHYGPLPKSSKGNVHIIVVVEAFTKFTFLKPVKSTNTKYVINFLEEIFALYGNPRILVSDQGSAFTSHKFQVFCKQNQIKHVLNAVATPRANGQVERFNRTLKSALLTMCTNEEKWDSLLSQIQFSINNVKSSSTGHTASELLHGFRPRRGNDSQLIDEISTLPRMIEDIVKLREEVGRKLEKDSDRQKERYDLKRKAPKTYKEGDLVVVEKREVASGSRKLVLPYSGPMVVKKVLDNDRYVVSDMTGTYRTRRRQRYENIVAVDQMKPWRSPGGVSDDTASDSGSDGVPMSDDDEWEDPDRRDSFRQDKRVRLETSLSQDGRM